MTIQCGGVDTTWRGDVDMEWYMDTGLQIICDRKNNHRGKCSGINPKTNRRVSWNRRPRGKA